MCMTECVYVLVGVKKDPAFLSCSWDPEMPYGLSLPSPCYCQCHGGLCLLGLCSPCAWQTLARGNGWRSPQGSRWPTVWSLPQCMHSQSPAEVGSRSAQSHRCGTCEVDRGVSLRNSRLQTQTWIADHPARLHFLKFHGLPKIAPPTGNQLYKHEPVGGISHSNGNSSRGWRMTWRPCSSCLSLWSSGTTVRGVYPLSTEPTSYGWGRAPADLFFSTLWQPVLSSHFSTGNPCWHSVSPRQHSTCSQACTCLQFCHVASLLGIWKSTIWKYLRSPEPWAAELVRQSGSTSIVCRHADPGSWGSQGPPIATTVVTVCCVPNLLLVLPSGCCGDCAYKQSV